MLEECPRELRGEDFPCYGGYVFFNDRGTAACVQCGWSGVPTVIDGVISTRCPACDERLGAIIIPKVGRNDPCSCGSGKKFKRCCGR